jgi:hypothetical protein
MGRRARGVPGAGDDPRHSPPGDGTPQGKSAAGWPAERPGIGSGVVAGREEEHLPFSVDCLQLLLEDVRRFWDRMPRGQGR